MSNGLVGMVLVAGAAAQLQRHSASEVFTVGVKNSPEGMFVYELVEQDVQRWHKSLPCLFEDIEVTNQGTLVAAGACMDAPSDRMALWIVAYDVKGRAILNHREGLSLVSLRVDVGPGPRLNGLVLSESLNSFWVRVEGVGECPDEEEWWCYDLATGLRSATLHPAVDISGRPSGGMRLVGARGIPDTTLCLIYWTRAQRVLFELVDLAESHLPVIWSREYSTKGLVDEHRIEDARSGGLFSLSPERGGKTAKFRASKRKPPQHGWVIESLSN